MKMFLTHKSALEYWRIHGAESDSPQGRHRKGRAPADPPNVLMLSRIKAWGLTAPLNVTVGEYSAKRTTPLVRTHLLSGFLPTGWSVDAGNGIIVASPELCFLQMANELPMIKLIELGLELCGLYALPVPTDGNEDLIADDRGFYNRQQALTNVKRLSTFASRAVGVPGQHRAQNALRYVSDSTASPMETRLLMLLTLPYRLGGYKLPMPELNARISLASSPKRNADGPNYFCDLFWPDAGVAVEYDSDMFHTGADRIAYDSKRRTDLASLGITVVTVTNQQIRSIVEFERVAKLLAAKMSKRLRCNENSGFLQAQRELRKLLF